MSSGPGVDKIGHPDLEAECPPVDEIAEAVNNEGEPLHGPMT